jgi:CTD small phosphatase-like protein 2
MNKYYELVIFTAAMQDYADWVLDNLDTNKIISYRLYRQHAVRNGAVFIKDMSKLGRDLSKVIIVDNVS